jgi:hypothetical protein
LDVYVPFPGPEPFHDVQLERHTQRPTEDGLAVVDLTPQLVDGMRVVLDLPGQFRNAPLLGVLQGLLQQFSVFVALLLGEAVVDVRDAGAGHSESSKNGVTDQSNSWNFSSALASQASSKRSFILITASPSESAIMW